jgi:diguanylate cyclase (GGDEF)-like protein
MGRKATSVTSSKKLSVTVSIGVSDSTDADLSAEQVIKKSDRALYRAKNKGRNQVST